jgi:hypothetical protein
LDTSAVQAPHGIAGSVSVHWGNSSGGECCRTFASGGGASSSNVRIWTGHWNGFAWLLSAKYDSFTGDFRKKFGNAVRLSMQRENQSMEVYWGHKMCNLMPPFRAIFQFFLEISTFVPSGKC